MEPQQENNSSVVDNSQTPDQSSPQVSKFSLQTTTDYPQTEKSSKRRNKYIIIASVFIALLAIGIGLFVFAIPYYRTYNLSKKMTTYLEDKYNTKFEVENTHYVPGFDTPAYMDFVLYPKNNPNDYFSATYREESTPVILDSYDSVLGTKKYLDSKGVGVIHDILGTNTVQWVQGKLTNDKQNKYDKTQVRIYVVDDNIFTKNGFTDTKTLSNSEAVQYYEKNYESKFFSLTRKFMEMYPNDDLSFSFVFIKATDVPYQEQQANRPGLDKLGEGQQILYEKIKPEVIATSNHSYYGLFDLYGELSNIKVLGEDNPTY